MALDKLVDSAQLDSDLASVANAIRTKGGTSASLAFPQGFVDAVDAIQTGGGGIENALLDGSVSGAYTNSEITSLRAQAFNGVTGLTSISLPNVTSVGANAFFNCTNIETLNLPKLANASFFYTFSGIQKLATIALPSFNNGLGAFAFSGDTLLATADMGTGMSGFGGQCFANTALSTLILRRSSVVPLNHVNNFNATSFASGKTGGTIYIPKSLYDHLGDGSSLDYKSATNWSTLDGYGTITWAPIEGSIYETQYADGTPIT